MQRLTFEKKAQGALSGAVKGAQLAFAKRVQWQRFVVENPAEIFNVKIGPLPDCHAESKRTPGCLVSFVELGVEAYLAKNGRVMPEDFAAVLKDHKGIATPLIAWDNIHTIQETLHEGMPPRLSGLGATPAGLICASMPAVGIYHAADPEYAYLDGVELASVAQPREAADWAGLCAAAIAAAFVGNVRPQDIVETVMQIAFRQNRELFYKMNAQLNQVRWYFKYKKEAEFFRWWLAAGGTEYFSQTKGYISHNPIFYVLPLLEHFADDVEKLMALLLIPGSVSAVTPVVAGAILGAMRGPDIFPADWSQCPESVIKKMLPMIAVAKRRLQTEKAIVTATEKLKALKKDGQPVFLDKVYGCLLASSIGNAMGSPVEGQSYLTIDQKHPGGIKTILEPSRLESEDDNQMAMLLVETYMERNGLPVTARHFGETWKNRLNRHQFHTHCMGSAYDMICEGWDPRIVGHWKPVTGATVMCMEPVGIYHILDPEFAVVDAIEISYMYQRGLDVTAAAVLAATVAEAFRPGATVESICRTAVEATPDTPFRTFDKRQYASPRKYLEACLKIAGKYNDVLAARKELYAKCLFYHMIDPLEVLGLSLAMFKIAKGDIRQAAIGGTNIGRDSDTIAGRAAMLSGILKGSKGVPKEWLALFKPESLARVKRNAAKLVQLITEKKLARMKARQRM